MPRKKSRRATATRRATRLGRPAGEDPPAPLTGSAPGPENGITADRGMPPAREEGVEEDEQKFRVPLGNKDADIRDVDTWVSTLRVLRENHPDHFKTLCSLARHGRREGLNEQSIDFLLREAPFFFRDGLNLDEELRAVLLRAGPKLEDPHRADSTGTKFTVAMAREEDAEARLKLVEKLLTPEKSDDQGRSPG